MLEKISSLRNRFILLGLSMVLVFGFSSRIRVQAADVAIKQEVSASSGQPGDVIQLSVYVQGMTGSVEAAKIRGVLEYDTSLFTIQDVTGNGFTTDNVNRASGSFSMTAGKGKTLQNGDMLFRISLQIKDKASVGQTTVCVNEVVVSDTAGAENHISNYIPSTISLEAADPEEDMEDKDEEEYEDGEDFDDVDDYKTVDTEKSSTKSSVSKSNTKKSNSQSNKKKATVSSGNKKVPAKAAASTKKTGAKLDENYKTGAGFGNDIYLMIAGILGIGVVGVYLIRRRWMKKKYKYL